MCLSFNLTHNQINCCFFFLVFFNLSYPQWTEAFDESVQWGLTCHWSSQACWNILQTLKSGTDTNYSLFKVHHFLHLFWKYLFWGSTFLTLLHLCTFSVLLICSCLGYFLYKRVQLNWANSWIMNSSLLIGRLCTVAVCACPCVMSLAWCEQRRITTGHVILSFSHIQQQLPHCGKHTHFHSESEV